MRNAGSRAPGIVAQPVALRFGGVSEKVAASIPGSRMTIMKGMGHFPMIENYPDFRPYLLEALRHVAG